MAALSTYRATSQAVTYTTGKSLIDVAVDSGAGAAVVKCWRIYHWNNQTGAITGALIAFRVYRTTTGASAPTGGATITTVKHDTNNAALAANITAGTGRTITDADLFRQYFWSTDEAALNSSTLDEWELFVPFTEVWNAGYGDTNVQPLTARAAQGFHLKQQGTVVVGTTDVEIEFSVE